MSKNHQTAPELAPTRTPDANPPAGASGLAPLASLRKYPFIALAALLVTLGVGAPLALKRAKPDYYSSAVIYVSPTFIRTLREDREQERQYTSYVAQQMLTISRYDILVETLEK